MSETNVKKGETYLSPQDIGELLDEPNVELLATALRTIGSIRLKACLEETLAIEANGGMLTEDKSRRRTPGGTFLTLLRHGVTYRERGKIFGFGPQSPAVVPVQPFTWDAMHQAIETLTQSTPQEATMKLTLIGRPGTTQTQGTAVVFQLKGKAPDSLPRGLPPLPKTPPMVWSVVVALRQWNKVKDSLTADPSDKLVIEGYPVFDGHQHLLLVNSCVSIAMKRAEKAQQKAASEGEQ